MYRLWQLDSGRRTCRAGVEYARELVEGALELFTGARLSAGKFAELASKPACKGTKRQLNWNGIDLRAW